MQSDLPWNVAGIPPEAREAARASARREGLSVGEWLTRRIMRSLAGADTASESWWALDVASPRHAAEDRSSAHESADMLARVSRTETESQNADRRIEEQLRTLGRRLEQTERSQSENSRAMTAAATEINIASREHAQAFDQLGTRVVQLGERVGRIEQHTAADGTRDAIKALHQGLSRLADQIAQTATNSAAQATQLANTIEAVAGKLADSRDDGNESARAIEERISALAANLGSVAGKLLEAQNESARQSVAVTERLAAVEKAIGSYESAQAARRNESETIRSHADTIARLSCSHDDLFRQFTASENDHAAGFARFEDRLSGIDERIGESDAGRRLQGVEEALTDMTIRLERSERDYAGVSGTIDDDLRNLSLRMDAADKRHKESIAELGALVKEAAGRLTNSHGGYRVAEPVVPPPRTQRGEVPGFDLPPFTGPGSAFIEPAVPDDSAAGELETSSPGDIPGIPPAFDIAAPLPGDTPETRAAAAKSFMDSARNTARAATSAQKERGENGAFFSWVGSPIAPDPGERTSMRPFLLAALGGLIIATIAAGLFLSQSAYTPSPAAHINPAPVLKPHPPSPPLQQAGITQQTVARTPASQTSPANSAVSVAGPAVIRSPAVHIRTKSVQARLIPPVRTVHAPAQSTPAPAPAVLSPQQRLAQLADGGNPKAQELVGLEYVDGDGAPVNEAEGAKWLERAADKGEAVAAYRLGTLYERGHGVPSDPLKAAQWYAAAAKAGNRKAMHNLAVAYAQGSGVQKDLASAAQWFAHAADLGLPDSQFNLGVLYERGMGVPQNLTDAYKWYAVAAAQGDSESKVRIEALASQISATDRAAAEKAAAEFHPAPENRAANSPPDAATLIGG